MQNQNSKVKTIRGKCQAGNCHGPSGLAMTRRGGQVFLQSFLNFKLCFLAFNFRFLVEK